MQTLTTTSLLVLVTSSASAQTAASGSVSVVAEAAPASSATTPDEPAPSSGASGAFDPGFETGLRLGVGLPLGKAGDSLVGIERNLSDLTPWRTPIWLDVGYRLSETLTLGLYGQVGFGGTGDACEGECDWSDLRVGVQGQWRLAGAGASTKPWLGVGIGFESLSFRTLTIVSLPNPEGDLEDVAARTAENLAGPELLLQLGLDFRVEDSLDIGPYVSATLAQYLVDDFSCQRGGCFGDDSVEGSGFHSWLGVGVRGSYLP